MPAQTSKESWSSRIGVILAVSGSAVGIGNFLRFPGQVAEFGGGAFMIAYFTAFLLVGLPMCWVEWTLGRHGGRHGFNAIPGIFLSITKRPIGKYLGCISMMLPTFVFMYVVCIEGWCLAYAVNMITGKAHFTNKTEAESFFASITGIASNGAAFGLGIQSLAVYAIFAFIANFILLYRGLSKGIELFCKFAMPTLVIIALILLVRVLTLGTPNPSEPESSINNGLGFMWNPQKVFLEVPTLDDTGTTAWHTHQELVGKESIENAKKLVQAEPSHWQIRKVGVLDQLKKPRLWLTAAGQIFFSLTVGFGVIATYASYLSKRDDIVLSGLSAASANEFCEVALGGLITIPAAVAFLGVADISTDTSLFSLGFKVLPLVFSSMPGGMLFGFLFFILLSLACTSACLAALQPGIAFLEESLNIERKQAVSILGLITGIGACFVLYFSHNLTALDTFDFWVGTCLIFIMGIVYSILFGWVLGVDKGFNEAALGAAFPIPSIFKYIIRYICPLFLISIFALWASLDVLCLGTGGIDHHITDIIGNRQEGIQPNTIAILSIGLIVLLTSFLCLLAKRAAKYQPY
ncbi:MAG TPA: sodium:calcium symporter [Opitutae bacterium]|nr:sodium:calcium symporter [Opitutae bacterium]|tara:strand:+ start:13632 stop:15365 length:1734 start_codon:yes stop_codon:yes gene_type:complete